MNAAQNLKYLNVTEFEKKPQFWYLIGNNRNINTLIWNQKP